MICVSPRFVLSPARRARLYALDWERKLTDAVSTKPKLETLLLWAWCLLWSVQAAIHAYEDTKVSGLVWGAVCLGFFVTVVSWVFADAHHRGVRLYYDFDFFIYVCWPVTLACYLISSRGVRALLTMLYACLS